MQPVGGGRDRGRGAGGGYVPLKGTGPYCNHHNRRGYRHWRAGQLPGAQAVSGLHLQVLLQAGLLKVAEELPDATVLIQELLNFRVKIDPLTAHDSYGPWREGQHDDLVLATAVACWYGERQPGYGVW